MATYYWVGGAGTWDASTTTNWALSSGGAGGAGVPTLGDDVVFDAASNATAYTVTMGTNAVCRDITVAGPASGNVTFSLATTSQLNCYGSFTLPATGAVWTGTGSAAINFLATTSGKTITTNGVTLTVTAVVLNSTTGGWTLGSALTTTSTFTVTAGSFDTSASNFTLTCTSFTAASAATINANASTIVCSATTSTFNGGGKTYYNLTFSSNIGNILTVNGANTFNNLTFTSRASTGTLLAIFNSNQIINGTLTFGTANTANRRMFVRSDIVGAQRTLTVNGALAVLSDVDFRDINAAGTVATPWTGTRLGNGLGNSNITFGAPKTVYWNLAAGGNWSATAWALSSGGAVNVNNFPLAQDTAIIEDTGLNNATSITIDSSWNIGTIDCSTRTLAATIVYNSISAQIYGDFTLSSSVNFNEVSGGSGILRFAGQGITQNITSAGTTITVSLSIENATGIFKLVDNLYANEDSTSAFILTSGNLDLNGKVLKVGTRFTANGTLPRSILFNGGKIVLEGKTDICWTSAIATGFSYTGNPIVEADLAVGNLTNNRIEQGTSGGGSVANSPTFKIISGTKTLGVTGFIKTLDFTGFTGTFTPNNAQRISENLILNAGMTYSTNNTLIFNATSGTQNITTNGVTVNCPVTLQNSATRKFNDAFVVGATRTMTCAGTLIFAAGTTNSAGTFVFNGTPTAPITLQSGTPGTQFTLSQASGTVNATYTTISDSNATGGATWNAFVDQNNIDAGNVDGWDFGISPVVGGTEYTYQIRSFTQLRRF